ncbi:40S ribosomal protein S6-like [Prionailurus iriomotensis]
MGILEMISVLRMKLKISLPVTSCQKLIEVDDECKLHTFSEKV